ncbi:LOW QUALITY PROTEIN: polycystin-1-like protein 1 [Pholidichthys leucotaenia]
MFSKAVEVYAAKQAYPTNTEIILEAITDAPDPVDFLWHFGDSRSARTASRTITQRYLSPGSYKIVVMMTHGQMAVTSDMFPLVIQRPVKLNRLVHPSSVLQNHTVALTCRVNVGTNLTFIWSFGDGTTRTGQSIEEHVFTRTGEFNVEVIASNLVSSASLNSLIFVVDQPCYPPPIKNMGPLNLQVRRYEAVRLGVTYDREVECDALEDLHYSWTLYDSAGQSVPLAFANTHRQSITLPGHFLQYDTYTAIAKVQVVGSVVYSNYSVRVQVMPSPPVAFIQGGTNVIINSKNTTVTLDGRASYNPDFPLKPLSYNWTCKPVSFIASSCFSYHIPTSSPVLKFPISFLKPNFDQFQFMLTVYSGEHSSSSETFLTVTSNPIRKVSVHCSQCLGDRVNWDRSFSLIATCEDCNVPARHIQYTWSLYLVNASSKPVIEVPFCSTVDLGAPSSITENRSTSPQTPGISTTHPPDVKPSEYTQTINTSPFPISVNASETEIKNQHLDMLGGSEFELSTHLNNGSVHYDYSDYFVQSDAMGKFSTEPDSSADWESPFPFFEDYDIPFLDVDEGDPGMSAGRHTGVDGESLSVGDVSMFDPTLHDDEGSNLMNLRPSVVIWEPTLLDLHRDQVDRGLFDSFTYTGISSPLISFKPFTLRPRNRYMLEVTAKFRDSTLGWTQLFLQTNPIPKGMTCQVQPVRGVELLTHFSIFCTSGREDLVFEYSFSVGGRPRRTLYQGRDFQYYFSLPSGDPNDHYKVTVYAEIRSSSDGSATKPCPVTVHVKPIFLRDISSPSSSPQYDPDLELSESVLRNLSVLVQLHNGVEIRNYISLLASILNRPSLETEANTCAQRHMRNVLICTMCELENDDEVTFVSARRVTARVQAISRQFSQHVNQKLFNSLISLLSLSLQVVTHSQDLESDCPPDESVNGAVDVPNGCLQASSTTVHMKQTITVSAKQVRHLVTDILQTASELMPKYILLHKTKEHRVVTSLISMYATSLNQTSAVISSSSATVYMPDSLIKILNHQHHSCVLTVLTELQHSPYTCSRCSPQGPVVELNLFKCSTRRKIPLRSLIEPVTIELQNSQKQKTSQTEFILLRSQVNYHSFNITQKHLQQAIQLTLVFTPPYKKPFPIMLLFRMNNRPTPFMYHLSRTHHWTDHATRITLPPAYLNGAGVGHLALLNADFEKGPRRQQHLSEQISYSLRVDSSMCLSWDVQRDSWTHHNCRTQRTDTSTTVNCSCHQLKPVTVQQQQIQYSYETADLDPFLRVPSDLTVLGVLVLCVCLFIPAFAVCKRADVISKENRGVHYLPDNSPFDTHLYAVTIHTGLCSAACMSAKVYITLYGEDGVSQTKELRVPGCTLFRRNSKDTFILSAAESLGSVWGVHIWHDNSGPSPDWYINQVAISEMNGGHMKGRCWLFTGQCWLDVSKGDGQVERMLRVCTQGISFVKRLHLKLCDYFADCHMWFSVCSCLSPSSFTHTQRLGVCLMLLSGYACVNAVIITQMDDLLPLEFGIVDLPAVSVLTGLLSVATVLPAGTVIWFLFRLHEVKLTQAGVRQSKSTTAGKGYQGGEDDSEKGSHDYVKDKTSKSGLRPTSQWCYYVAWALSLLWTLSCLVLSAVLGMRFKNSKALLWVQSLSISLMSCIFLIQPALILVAAIAVSFWHRTRPDIHGVSLMDFEIETSNVWSHSDAGKPKDQFRPSAFMQKRYAHPEKLLEARRRARYLHLVRPPTPAELKKARGKKRREALIHKTLRDFSLSGSMLFLIFLITYDSSFSDHYQLNRAVRRRFVRSHPHAFMSIQTHEDWWKWTQTSLLDLLYKNEAVRTESHIVIGEPVLHQMKMSDTFPRQIPMMTSTKKCGQMNCYTTPSATVGLGRTKSAAASKLKFLRSGGWLDEHTVAQKVQFTLYSHVLNLFTSVTLREQSPTDLLPSATVQSVRVYHTPAVWDYVFQLIVTVMYYVCSIHRSTIIMEAVEVLQKHGDRGHVDVTLLSTRDQLIRTLRGIILFLLSMKCAALQKLNRTFAASAALFFHSLWSLSWLMIPGLILLLALSCLGKLLQSSWDFSPIPQSMWTLFCHYRGLGATRGLLFSGCDLFYRGVLYLSFAVVSTAVVRNTMSSLVRRIKRSQSRRNFFFTISDLAGYIRQKVIEFTGQHRQAWNENYQDGRTYYLEEFEAIVDELLFKLNALSNSLHHTLPPKAHCYRECSPIISSIPEPPESDTRSQVELMILQQRGCMIDRLCYDTIFESCDTVKYKNDILYPESASRKKLWTKEQVDQLVRINDSCRLMETQTLHTEVEVLVHEKPEWAVSDSKH